MTSGAAVRQRPPAVLALLVAEVVEELVRRVGIVLDDAAVMGIVTDDAGRDGHLQVDRLALADHLDLFFDVVGHRHRPAQRDLVLREAADDGIAHVERGVREVGVGDAVQHDALVRERGLQLVAVEHVRRERLRHVHVVDFLLLEREPARLGLLDDRDLDAPDLRHAPALHRRDQRLVPRVVGRLEVPDEAPILGIRLQHDLRAPRPALQLIRVRCRPGAPSCRRRTLR